MAQRSLPQAGDSVGDSGPYSGDEWTEFFQAVFTGDQEVTQGPLSRFWDELEVTGAGLVITTGTGAGFVYGHFLINDAPVPITVALTAAGQSRWDRVVMVQNNANVPYNTNLALPAAYAAGVPRNSARIAIRQGSSGTPGILPTLESGPSVYMVELYRYQVDDVTVGALDDRRDRCEFSHNVPNVSRKFFVPIVAGWNRTDGVEIAWPGAAMDSLSCSGFVLPDDKVCTAVGHFIVPTDYVGDMEIKPIVTPWPDVPGPEGNIYVKLEIKYSKCEEDCDTHTADWLYRAVSTTYYGKRNCINFILYDIYLATLEVGDIVYCRFFRDAVNAADTMDNPIMIPGFHVTYTGRQVVYD